ncbi:MAG: hypothetical protein H0T46_19705 [Deltaproteobacteria bacterium]|nr:hypothetical protein [Deltaproteobacteria bacterium]
MLRSILVGLLAISAVAACKGGTSDAPEVQPGATVGKVVEITGAVTATRGTQTRTLDASSTVSGDDVIQTSGDGRVTILLAHNNATWALGPNKKEQVSGSMAWKLAKADSPATAVDETTTAAGRHAERQAATGEAESAGRERESAAAAPRAEAPPAPVAAPAPAATEAMPAPAPPPPPPAADKKTVGSKGATPKSAPKPEVSAKNARTANDDVSDMLEDGGGTRRAPSPGGGGGGGGEEPDALTQLKAALERETPALRACVTASGLASPRIKFQVVAGKTTITFADGAGTDSDRACLAKVAARIKLTVDLPASVTIALPKL